jgi:EmrB/QacA subfamily drug resistance transporter
MRQSRWLALVVLCAGLLMIILDQTIVTVALPAIQHDLGFTGSGLAWVVNAYVIPFGGLLLLAGRLGDRYGRKRLFVTGLVLFTTASLLCGLATTPGLLIAARFGQGIGGATTSAVILGMIVPMFPEPRARGRAIAVYSFVGSAGATIGFLAGGVLTEALSWHWIFFVNVPIGVLTAVLATRLPAQESGALETGAGADVAGAVLVTGGLMVSGYAIVATSPAAATLAVALLVGFVAREATATAPLLPLRVFRSRNVTGGNLVQALMVAGLLGYQFLNTLYLQRVLGYGPVAAGLAVVPTALAIGVLSLGFSARLIGRFGSRTVLLGGLALIAVGLGLLARVPVDGRYPVDILPGMLLLGIGGGAALPAVTALAMSDATADDAGLASGLVNTTQQIGAALGLAALAAVAAARTAAVAAQGAAAGVTAAAQSAAATAQSGAAVGRTGAVTAPAALAAGYQRAFLVSVGLVVVAMLVAATVLRRPLPPGETAQTRSARVPAVGSLTS